MMYFRRAIAWFFLIMGVAFTLGLDGPLMGYREGAANLGLVCGTDYTLYTPVFWPFLSHTNPTVAFTMESTCVTDDIRLYPRLFVGDIGYWVLLSAVCVAAPLVIEKIRVKKDKKVSYADKK